MKFPQILIGRKFLRSLSLLHFTFLAMVATTFADSAEPNTTITGRVIDGSTGQLLRGAIVRIEGSSLVAVSDLQGTFRLVGVPAGHQSLWVTYLGTPDLHQAVEAVAGQQLTLTVAMHAETVAMGKYVVTSLREGQAKALNQQKNSETVVNIIGSDSIGRFPDPNTAEALQRVAGISLERDTGEGRYVNIRGISSEYNSVTSDGQLVASNSRSNRHVNLNVIPSGQVSQIEVIKSKTPDLAADGIGGTVNLVMKSALDTDHAVAQGTVAVGKLTYKKNTTFDAAVTAGTPFGSEKQFGLLVTAEFSRVPRAFDDIEENYDTQPIGGQDSLVLADYELRNYLNILTHRSFSANFDARPDANNRYFVRASYNRYDDDRRRRLYAPNFSDGDRYSRGLGAGDVLVPNLTITSQLQTQFTKQELINVSAGGKNVLGLNELDYDVAYSFGGEKSPYDSFVTFLRSTGVDEYYNRSNFDAASFGPTNAANVYDAALSKLQSLTTTDYKATDGQYSGGANYKLPADLFGGREGYFKFGARASDRTKKYSQHNGTLLSPQTSLASLAEFDDPPFQYRARYRIGPMPDVTLSNQFIASNAAAIVPDLVRADRAYFTAREHIYAAYGLYSLVWEKLHVLGGLRLEDTRNKVTTFTFPKDANGVALPRYRSSFSRNYQDVFPSAHLKYDVSKDVVIRSSFSTSIIRPQFADVAGSQQVTNSLPVGRISGGNPNLKPTLSHDYDLSAEYYLPSLGIVSVGAFYKDIRNYVFTRTATLTSGLYSGYRFSGPSNIGRSHLAGVELAYNHQMKFLPGAWSGLGVYANSTFISSRGEIRPGESASLPKQARQVQNLALYYEKYGVTARLALTHTGSFLYSVGSAFDSPGNGDVFYDKSTQLDFTGGYAFNSRYSFFVAAQNLTNQPLRFYETYSNRPVQREFYDVRVDVGFKFDL